MSKSIKYIIIYLVTIVTLCAYSVVDNHFRKNDGTIFHVNSDQQELMSRSLNDANRAATAFINNPTS